MNWHFENEKKRIMKCILHSYEIMVLLFYLDNDKSRLWHIEKQKTRIVTSCTPQNHSYKMIRDWHIQYFAKMHNQNSHTLQYVMHAWRFHNILSIRLQSGFFFIEHEEQNEYQRFWDFEVA